MIGETNKMAQVKAIAMMLCFVIAFLFCFADTGTPTADIAFAAENEAVAASVGDYETVTFTAYPIEACQDCTWTLTWDKDKTSAITYSVIKSKNPYDYIGLSIEGSNCTVSVLKYHKVGITYTVYLTLTATSTENTDLSATCSIKLG